MKKGSAWLYNKSDMAFKQQHHTWALIEQNVGVFYQLEGQIHILRKIELTCWDRFVGML